MCTMNAIKKLTTLTLLTLSVSSCAATQQTNVVTSDFTYPNGARYAVSLTFDDARNSQVDVGIPILDKHNVKGTFYVNPKFVDERLDGWKKAAKNGHELGNHTSSHLCTGNFAWLRKDDLGLEQVDLAWLRQDIEATTTYMKEKLDVEPRSFAYPCGNTFVGRGKEVKSYVPLIAELFKTGRTWLDETGNNPTYTDFAQLAGNRMDGMSFVEIKALLDMLKENNKWIILAGHEVGKKGLYTTDKAALDALIVYLKDPKNGYWLATVDEIATYIEKHR
ncbi:polysaccharide deacetylase family protein [Pseudoalteromonas luteoviolacea]|uniref:polysaccharide deacetylase family protein n=1 Tax=Pseudoalteromonas luteoviolacea TaxID=43657 RepID=UPI001F45E2F3|nr:polysaccharide deacetylase family protein [Pseudoalteromonas luteoviolacea]MCF6442253.1 polysaccharide deacetylase family protein [Pseudoalteromonas luteoviolacea]